MSGTSHTLRWVALALVLTLMLFAGQSLAASTAPEGGVSSTGRIMGQTGFAYLSGLRTFAAAVLWTRLEPIYHEYYGDRELNQLDEFLPTMRLIQALDPQFEQVYYNAAWILHRRGREAEALSVAEEGVANNPTSGLLLANHVQILLAQDRIKNLDAAYKSAVTGLGPTARWANDDDKIEGYGIFRSVFVIVGDQTTVDKIDQVQAALRAR